MENQIFITEAREDENLRMMPEWQRVGLQVEPQQWARGLALWLTKHWTPDNWSYFLYFGLSDIEKIWLGYGVRDLGLPYTILPHAKRHVACLCAEYFKLDLKSYLKLLRDCGYDHSLQEKELGQAYDVVEHDEDGNEMLTLQYVVSLPAPASIMPRAVGVNPIVEPPMMWLIWRDYDGDHGGYELKAYASETEAYEAARRFWLEATQEQETTKER